MKYTEAILSHNTRKLLWFETSKMLGAAVKNTVLFTCCVILSCYGSGNSPAGSSSRAPVGGLRDLIPQKLKQFC